MSVSEIEDLISILLLFQHCYRTQPVFLPPHRQLKAQGIASQKMLYSFWLTSQAQFTHRQILDVKCFTEFSSRYVETLGLLETYFNITPVSNPYVIPLN
jgi:hypothetical protein